MLDPENWKIIFEVYAEHPVLALTHAYQLIAISNLSSVARKEYPTLSRVWIWQLKVFTRTPTSMRWAESFIAELSKTNSSVIRRKNSVNSV